MSGGRNSHVVAALPRIVRSQSRFCLLWKASLRNGDHRQRKFYDRRSSIEAVATIETENVLYLQPVSFGLSPAGPTNPVGRFFRAAHPSAQFLAFILIHNSHLVFETVLVRHALSPSNHANSERSLRSDRRAGQKRCPVGSGLNESGLVRDGQRVSDWADSTAG